MFAAFEPPGVVTTTLAVPPVPDGVVAVIEVALTTVTLVAAVPPIVTPVAPVRLVPVIVTLVPPASGPLLGPMPLTVGATPYVYNVFTALVPPGVVTSTLAVPAVPDGVVAVIEVALTTVTLVAAVPPIVTAVVPVKLVPVIVTLVPPASGPLLGLMPLTVGAATYV